MILTFSQFKDAHPSPKDASKTIPPKVTGSDGQSYALTKAVFDVITNNLGIPLDVDVKTEVKGAFTNRSITAARLPAAPPVATAGPVSPPNPPSTTQQGAAPFPTPPSPGWRHKDDDVQRLIVRQSCLKAAIETVGPIPRMETEDEIDRAVTVYAASLLDIAELYEAWVYRLPNGAPADTSPKSQAEQHLETARQKTADIRAGYDREDMVCAECGRKEFITPHQGAYFCSRRAGGCGAPDRGEQWLFMTYGEWLDHQPEAKLRRPDAPVVSPATHPTR